MTRLHTCFFACTNDYQDEKYGRGVRVQNQTKQNVGDRSKRGWRCTCGKVQ